MRSAAIVQLSIVSAASSVRGGNPTDENYVGLNHAVRIALSCAPADPYLLLVFYWLENVQEGFQDRNSRVLRMSYRLGPNEAWVALKRNRIAFAIFHQLPPDLAENAMNEFTRLIESKFIDEAVDIFTGPAWSERDLLLSRLERVAEVDRQSFSNALHNRGYDVNVPGTASGEFRPVDGR